ncbi:MAG: hypothetical protein N3G78_06560 [Desulfobacterota bacterium]|nr:hypothetical protein [Thermodesulfobacteriota bacterium]
MKTFLKWVIFSFHILLGLEASFAVEFEAQTWVRSDWWKDDVNRQGQQVYIPICAEARFQNLSLRILTGEAYTRLDPRRNPNRSLATLLDTKVNFSYEIIEKLPVDLLVGLDFNLPTGKSNLKLKDRGLLMDPDLVSINKFGEGFNVNPNLSIAKDWGRFAAGVGLGYVWRGEYDFTTQVLEINDFLFGRIIKFYARDYDPGEIFNINAELRYDVLPRFQGRLYSQYVWYGRDRLKKKDFYQEGDLWMVGMGLQYSQEEWEVEITLRGLLRGKSKVKQDPGDVSLIPPDRWYLYGLRQPIRTEPKNSHGDEWVADLSIRYFLDEKTALKSFLQGLYVTKNDYPFGSPRFLGRREKGSLGLGLSRVLHPSLQGELIGRAFLMHDEERFMPEFQSERNYRGYSVGLYLTGKF